MTEGMSQSDSSIPDGRTTVDIGQSIASNRFVDGLREGFVVDRAAFAALCGDLHALKLLWKNEARIDKEIMHEVYGVVMTAHYAIASFQAHRPELADDVREMALTVDALVMECLRG